MKNLKDEPKCLMMIQQFTNQPGDLDKSGKLKKTKPSKHTLKFKKMFGEMMNEMIGLATRLATINHKDMLVRLAVSDKQFLK